MNSEVEKYYKSLGKKAQKAIKEKYGEDGMKIIGSNGGKKRWKEHNEKKKKKVDK